MNASTPIPPPTAYFSNLSREHGFEEAIVEGVLPPDLRGTLYRNGPGLMEQFGRRYDHLFEGDGAISAVRFEGGRAAAAARVIESAGLSEERAAGRHLNSYAAPWLTRLRRMHRGQLKNTANTNVVPWQGGLYALMEGAKPTEIDPRTLATLGATDLGVIPSTFSAHPHRVESRRTLYNFGVSNGRETTLDLFALPDEGPAAMIGRIPLQRPVMLHDFAATDRHLIFFISPLNIVIWRMMLALRPFQDNFRWEPDAGTEVIVVPIDAPDAAVRFHTAPFLQFHFAGAYEERGELVVDYVRYEDSALLWSLGDGRRLSLTDVSTRGAGGRLHRARINPATRELRSEPLWNGDCEFPGIGPVVDGRYRHIWLQSELEVDGALRFQITRLDADGAVLQHTLERGQISSESVLAGGSVLTLVYDSFSARSHLLVLDAETLAFQARVMLKQAIPLTFHGSWLPE